MSIFYQHNYLDLKTIKKPDGNSYYGDANGENDEVKLMLANKWRELDEKFFSRNKNVVFKTPSIRSGQGKGSQGYSYPRVASVKTRKGKFLLAWADEQKHENGQYTYLPVLRKIGLNEKTLTLGPEDIEEALWMSLFNPNLISEKRPSGKTYLEDLEMEALKYEESESKGAVIAYWLFSKGAGFYSDEEKISVLALAWGINTVGKTLPYMKQLLAEAVKRAEKSNNPELNFAAFDKICHKMRDGQDTVDVEIMALIQRGINARTIKFDRDVMAWVLLGVDGNTIKTLCRVPPQMVDQNKVVLRKHLIEHRDDVETLYTAVDQDTGPDKYDVCMLKQPLPDVITEDFIVNTMSWDDRRAVYVHLGNRATGVNKETVNAYLVEFFIQNNGKLNWKLKPTK